MESIRVAIWICLPFSKPFAEMILIFRTLISINAQTFSFLSLIIIPVSRISYCAIYLL